MDKAILFDLDGTLVETAPDLMEAHNYVMRKYGYEEKPFEAVRYLAGRGAAQMLVRSIDSQGRLTNQNNKINEETHKKMTSDFIDYYAENISKTSVINQGVVEYLEWKQQKKLPKLQVEN